MDDLSPPPPEIDAESTRTIGRTSVRNPRIEVITRREPRRSWTLEQKREIVAESLGPALTATEVARKYAISSGQLYTWRHQLLSNQSALMTYAGPQFAQVELASSQSTETPVEPPAPVSLPVSSRSEGAIEIVLPTGITVRVDAAVDGRALRRVLGALEGR